MLGLQVLKDTNHLSVRTRRGETGGGKGRVTMGHLRVTIGHPRVTIGHHTPLVRSDKYFVSFSTCNPTACSHWLTQSQKEALLFIYYWLTHYLFLLLLAQYTKLVTSAHEHGAMIVGAG